EFQLNGVELLAHGLPPLLLPRHDESAADVAVLHQPFAEFHSQLLGQCLTGYAAAIGDRYYHVDVVVGPLAKNFRREILSLPQARLVDGNSVHDGVRPGKVDVLENAGLQAGILRALATVELACL